MRASPCIRDLRVGCWSSNVEASKSNLKLLTPGLGGQIGTTKYQEKMNNNKLHIVKNQRNQ